jgi:hypothetical protein
MVGKYPITPMPTSSELMSQLQKAYNSSLQEKYALRKEIQRTWRKFKYIIKEPFPAQS